MKFLLIILSRILQLIFWCVGTSILFCGILFINGIIYLWAFNTKNWIAIEKEMFYFYVFEKQYPSSTTKKYYKTPLQLLKDDPIIEVVNYNNGLNPNFIN